MDLLIGIDVGTGSSKGVLTTLEGAVVARAEAVPARASERTVMPAPGHVEQDADAVWWDDVRGLLRELTVAAGRAGGSVAGVCVSGIGPTVLPADAAGRPLRPAILYGVDTRAVDEIAWLEKELGAEAIVATGGSALSTQSAGPKVRWLQTHEPDVWERTRYLFMANSYAVFRLTGAYVLDHHSASQSSPLYDVGARAWVPEWAAVVAPGLELPELRWPGDLAGHVTPAAAAETGLAVGTPVAVGTVDAWAEAESVDVASPGELMLMYGSTAFFVAPTAAPVRHAPLWTTVGVRPGAYSLAGGMASTGSLTGWFRHLTDPAGGFAELFAEAAAVPAGSRGLLTLPYFLGERTPVSDPEARGAILGLTLRHGRADVFRSILEGVAYGIRQNLEFIAASGTPVELIVAIGGGTTGDLWTQIVSDVTGLAQQVPRERSGACYGDAKLAGVAIGAVDPNQRWNAPGITITPRESDADVLSTGYRLYRELYPATAMIQHGLAELERSAVGGARRPA
ncbi:FGGY-family carbohydrate kinase [Spongisporangium articulatum]|uniref:FGGY-family carbohydrate kinase n=1 Tax=Spongisporangium articulatum TaxID=3362603 RepID=A0ABW8AM05_9ACTN